MGRLRFTKKRGLALGFVAVVAMIGIVVTNNDSNAPAEKPQVMSNKTRATETLPQKANVKIVQIAEDSGVSKKPIQPSETPVLARVDKPTVTLVNPVSQSEIKGQPALAELSHNFSLEQACKAFVPRLPTVNLATCNNSMMLPTGATSVNGQPIIAREIPAAKGVKEPLRILLIGGIHGDELSSSAIVFRWLKFIKGPMSRTIHWKIAPIVNPDGFLASPGPMRTNANGIDLNRNFPMPDWLNSAPNYWKKVTGSDPRRFPGKAPLSEPESKWIHKEIMGFKPHVVISVHAPFGLLDFDGPVKPPYKFGGLYFNPLGVYPGSLGNYGMADRVPIITIELPNGGVLPGDEEVLQIWQDMNIWIKKNVSQKPKKVPTKSALVPTSLKK